MVRAILAVILGDYDQSTGCVWAVRHSFHQATDGKIVVGLLGLRRVDTRQRRGKGSRVIVTETNQRQVGQVFVGHIRVEFALPLVVAPQIRIVLVVAAEVDIGQRGQ